MNEMIFTDNLGKDYQDLVALDGLSLQIPPGEIFGLLGPNGAGKTTTIKILTTLARPSRGTARIHDFDVVRQPLAVKKLIGVCPQEINLDRELTAFENLWIYGRLHRMPDLPARIAELLDVRQLAGTRPQPGAGVLRRDAAAAPDPPGPGVPAPGALFRRAHRGP